MGDGTGDYKLTYFNARGLTEPIRYIFAFAKVPFQDIRIEKEQWPALKPNTPWGQVPILEYDGEVFAQSSTIARFLARQFGLTGKNEKEAAKCDELVDAITDLKWEWRKYFFEADEDKKAALKDTLINVHIVNYFSRFEQILKGKREGEGEGDDKGRHLVGDSVTWADLFVACYLDTVQQTVAENVLDGFPELKALKESVEAIPQIQQWIQERPPTAN